MLDPEHPRQGTDVAVKAVFQRDAAECLQQLSLFDPGCEALKADADAIAALDMLVDKAWSKEAKVCAEAALKQLCPERYEKAPAADPDGGEQRRHIMMSCELCPHPMTLGLAYLV